MNRIIFATGNKNKVRECHEILEDVADEIVSMKEAGLDPDIDENGSTFEENAMIKAKAVHDLAPDSIVIADDSGLVVDALNGEPGIYSARYLGEDTSYDIKNAKILERMQGVPREKRTARFVCAMAVIMPDGDSFTKTGVMEGYIGDHAEGENGFGYDPIFFVEPQNCSTAVLSPDEKNAISHRGQAMRAIAEELKVRSSRFKA
ncbi:MAG: XTP/dITP diphosphatase [Lachnospiraceae bacterium]|nr:XTP/dITP diphosphatase [Lachnospiraceae bacterium]MDD7327498.1 XTP/dITP diphosphatase [Lachnospiraceae bacterium]MDY2760330.1 XTP/dITP diphosphatase [Lachnospiraceae bacterium]